jgi:hypothetical protein
MTNPLKYSPIFWKRQYGEIEIQFLFNIDNNKSTTSNVLATHTYGFIFYKFCVIKKIVL